MNIKFKLINLLLGLIIMTSDSTATAKKIPENAHAYSFQSIKGKDLPLDSFKGRVVLIVNTASKCGFTKQYDGLEKLYLQYKDRGLVILGVPSNDFGGQEPGDEQEIQNFCKINFGVTFPLTKKEKVIGKDAHPFYKWAKKELGFGTGPKWNFHKYLITRDGELVDYFVSTTKPESPKIIKAIEKLL